MIAFLEGIVMTGGTDAVVSVGGGIGLDVHLSSAAAAELPAPGESVRLWTHLVVREDAWSLYGFLDPRALPLGELGRLASAGAIPLIYSAIGLKVGAELSAILEALKGDRA